VVQDGLIVSTSDLRSDDECWHFFVIIVDAERYLTSHSGAWKRFLPGVGVFPETFHAQFLTQFR
jgi:hypothetical protein